MHINIYGDNIIECERALEIIIEGIKQKEGINIEIKYKLDNLICPSVVLKSDKSLYELTLYPGVNKDRWGLDIYNKFITDRGGLINEGADALITTVKNNKEFPLMAFEFSNALPAGNNAWQRLGRALSFSQADIPYFYITELGGNELNKDGTIKNVRMPNSVIILSYILNSIRRKVPNGLVYRISPVASEETKDKFNDIINDDIANISYELLHNSVNSNVALSVLKKNYRMYELLSTENERLKEDIIFDSFLELDEDKILQDIKKKNISWRKKLGKIENYGKEFLKLRDILSKYCLSTFSKESLPFAFMPKENIDDFLKTYKMNCSSNQDFLEYLENNKEDVIFCLVNGFKSNNGGDSRPDRGIVPFVRMLMGESIKIITIVYGPVPDYHKNLIINKDYEKVKSNGLFASVMGQSNFMMIIDKNSKIITYENIKALDKENMVLTHSKITRVPKKFGEMDVDTSIHLLFSHLFNNIFESFCNPPGGDWSGISIIYNKNEYRWLSLERAPKGVKRPDHIIQFTDTNTLILIESKDTYNNLIKYEKSVGINMIQYLHNLKNKGINAERNLMENKPFSISKSFLRKEDFVYKTGISYIDDSKEDLDIVKIKNIMKYCKVDIVLIFRYEKLKSNVGTKLYIYCEDKSLINYMKNNLKETYKNISNLHIYLLKEPN